MSTRPTYDPADPEQPSVYELVGGLDAFVELVDRFYGRVEQDPVLRPVYPEDLGPGKQALAEFLAQYWGGPDVYSATRGHPRLRRRHAPFRVTARGAQHWAAHMVDAIHSMDFDERAQQAMVAYVLRFAPTMVNTYDEPPPAPPRGGGLPVG